MVSMPYPGTGHDTRPRKGRGLGKVTLHRIAESKAVLEKIRPAGVRAVCYQLFNRDNPVIPNMSKGSTDAISGALTKARKHGLIPWDWIVDESRELEIAWSFDNPDDFVQYTQATYRKNRWQDQGSRIIVVSEKGTVSGTLRPVVRQYGVDIMIAHGYNSTTVAHNLAQATVTDHRKVIILYVGDHDPSGRHMSDVDLPNRIGEYGGIPRIHRLALTADDIQSLPTFPASDKKKDARYKWFVKTHGDWCAELDALDPRILRSRVSEAIESYINWERWERAATAEEAELTSLTNFLGEWQSLTAFSGLPENSGGAA